LLLSTLDIRRKEPKMLRNNISARNHLAMVGTLTIILLGSFGCAGQNWVIDTVREMDKDLVVRMGKIEAAAAAEKTRVDQQLTEVRGIGTDARNRADEAGRAAQVATQKADAAIQKTDVATPKADPATPKDDVATQKVDAAIQKADVASQKADAATQKADAVDGRLTRVLANRLKRTQVQQADVTFDTGKSVLRANAQTALFGILKVLADNPTYTADLMGHTDTVGRADKNVILSWQREEVVRRFMVEKGVAANRLFFIGVGEELSGDDANDAAKREKNRRVTITVFKSED
jgi:outer membrane protein OmpA-like peptidoglycan-associated protein